jgi:hypothetical protein
MTANRIGAILLITLLGGCALFSGRPGGDARGTELKRRGATVALALERYRRDNGRLPVHLYELLPKYLPQLPDGLATDYRPQDNSFAFLYQPVGESLTTTCEIAIGARAWNCHDSL